MIKVESFELLQTGFSIKSLWCWCGPELYVSSQQGFPVHMNTYAQIH